ncbi:MAG: cytochrome c biogenesis protein ResB [Deltaproteobacteria bacterium]|nr:cytochrome c biogenesis protein ResB [Deltaproteobacteria bacterium]
MEKSSNKTSIRQELWNILYEIWNFFASMQLSVVTILFLAITSILGTVIHQSGDSGHNFQHYGPFWFQFFETLDLFDMYHSIWYQAAFLILSINIIVCSIDKLSSTWKIIFKKDPSFSFSKFENLKSNVTFKVPGSLKETELKIKSQFLKLSKNIKEEKVDGRITFYTEKGRKTRLGVYVVHLSILFMIVGGAIGMYFGFEGFVNIPEGKSITKVLSKDRTEIRDLGFELRCDNFDLTLYKNSKMAKEYRSDLVVIENNKEVLKKSIIVNDPLRYKGYNFYQSSYSEISSKPNVMTAVFRSNETGIEYSKKMKIGDKYEIPEGLGTFSVDKYDNYLFRGNSLGDAVFGTIKRDGKKPVEVVVPLDHPQFDMMRNKMKKGKVYVRFTDIDKSFQTGLQVTSDPGVWWVYLGFILLIAGCYITFFMCHRSICISISSNGKKCKVMVSGTANKNKQGMKFWVEKYAGKIENACK